MTGGPIRLSLGYPVRRAGSVLFEDDGFARTFGLLALATTKERLLLLALVMTQEDPMRTDGPDGWLSGLPAEPFPEIALARLPHDLREALQALWLVIRGSASYFAARARWRLKGSGLGVELAALGRDLETLAALAKDSAGRGEAEPADLRVVAFEAADQLGAMAQALRAKLEAKL